MSDAEKPKEETPFERFRRITKEAISIPKKELEKREKEWKRAKNKIN